MEEDGRIVCGRMGIVMQASTSRVLDCRSSLFYQWRKIVRTVYLYELFGWGLREAQSLGAEEGRGGEE